MPKVTIRDIPLSGQRVFMRVDFNVPLEEKDGKMVITSDTRIKETIPTIEYLIKQGARLILASHLGRPKGKRDPKQSLKPAADRLAEILKKPVSFVDDCIGPKVAEAVAKMSPGDVLVLENVRFYAQEEKNDPEFSKQLAAVADVYVNDAFGSAHRAHASTEGMARQVKTMREGRQEVLEPLNLELRIQNAINQADRDYYQEHRRHLPEILQFRHQAVAIQQQRNTKERQRGSSPGSTKRQRVIRFFPVRTAAARRLAGMGVGCPWGIGK